MCMYLYVCSMSQLMQSAPSVLWAVAMKPAHVDAILNEVTRHSYSYSYTLHVCDESPVHYFLSYNLILSSICIYIHLQFIYWHNKYTYKHIFHMWMYNMHLNSYKHTTPWSDCVWIILCVTLDRGLPSQVPIPWYTHTYTHIRARSQACKPTCVYQFVCVYVCVC